MRIRFILFFLTLGFVGAINAQSFKEKIALYELYQATKGENWKYQWDLKDDVSQWKGVVVQDNKVVELDLSGFNLNGALPKTLDLLINLKVLKLADNKIVGNFPVQVLEMKNLVTLDLGSNKFDGVIPEEIATLESLAFLDLSNNGFSGKLTNRLGSLKKLEVLDVAFNNLEGGIPSEIGNMKNLRELAVQFNRLDGEIPSSISKLKKLRVLQISNNHFQSFDALSGIQKKQLTKFDMQQELPQFHLLKTSGATRVADIKFEDRNR